MRRPARCSALALLAGALACARATPSPSSSTDALHPLPPVLTPQRSGTTALLQAVSVVSDRVVWVSGHDGTYARTTNGGATWAAARVPGADTLQFRDVEAVSADTAWLMSAGAGDLSRIYTTTDGGAHWTLRWRSAEPRAFLDCIARWDARRAVAVGDAVGGVPFILLTSDGGEHWARVPAARLPTALPDEGGFAASGTCVATAGSASAWAGMGNTTRTRVLRTTDGGRSWSATEVPVASGNAAGIASVAFRDARHGIALGGEIAKPTARGVYAARTSDGGGSWAPGGPLPFAGAVYGGAYVPGAGTPTLVAVGPGGAALSRNDGRSWMALDTLSYWSVGFASPRAGWAVGPHGRIVMISVAGAPASRSAAR